MDRWFWRCLGATVAIAALVLIVYVPDPTAPELSMLSNQQLLDLLQSPRSVIRDAATGQLLARAKTVVPTLSTAAISADDDERPAIIGLLQELFLSNDPVVAEAAETALENLSRHPNRSVADIAESVLASNLTLRHARALTQFRQLGGQVRDLALNAEPVIISGNTSADNTWLTQAHVLLFDANWQGGDDGLKYLLRVFPFDPLAIHLTRDAPISAEAIQQIRTRRSRINVRRQDESCLGVIVEEARGAPSATGVRFAQVVANSPAARAGLRRGDRLTAFNGRAIGSFSELQECAASCRPGDRVELRVERYGTTYHVKLPLGSDFRTGICGCASSDAGT